MKISVVTAVYNNSAFIEDAILSVLNQNYKNIEYIIIDGGSKDGTLDKINKYRDRISLIISEPDKGIYDAINKGIKASTGDAVALLHSDDIFAHNSVLSNIAAKFNSTSADSVYADLEYITKNNNKVIRKWDSGEYKTLLFGWMPPHPTFVVKRDLLIKYGLYNINYRISSDYDMVLRLLGRYKISAAYLPEVIMKMRVGGASNKSLRNIYNKSKEDYLSLRGNKMPVPFFTLLSKNLRKITQFV